MKYFHHLNEINVFGNTIKRSNEGKKLVQAQMFCIENYHKRKNFNANNLYYLRVLIIQAHALSYILSQLNSYLFINLNSIRILSIFSQAQYQKTSPYTLRCFSLEIESQRWQRGEQRQQRGGLSRQTQPVTFFSVCSY